MGITAAITAVAAAAGTATSVVGINQQRSAANAMADSNQQILKQQQQAEALRQQAMEIQARRQAMSILRQQQSARAISLSTATNQGASIGSAVGGAYGSIAGQSNTNLLGVNQNLQFGQQMFGINSNINAARYSLAGAQSDYSAAQSLTSLGNQIISAGPTLGRIGTTVAGWGSTYSNPYLGNYGGTGGNLGGYY